MEQLVPAILPIFLFVICMIGLALGLLVFARIVRPGRPGRVTRMPYESGMDPIHDTRRRFDVRFYLVAIAFLVFDVELLFLYPWAVVAGEHGMSTSVPVNSSPSQLATQNDSRESMENTTSNKVSLAAAQVSSRESVVPRSARHISQTGRHLVFAGVMTFLALLTLGFVYDWRKGVFQWR
jgi:NADH-quinone oxidoreductase subunit A